MGNEYNAPKMTRFFTVQEVADALAVKPNTIRAWIKLGKIRAVKIVGAVRIPEDAVNEIVEVR